MSADLTFSSGLSECFAGVGRGSKWDLVPLSGVIMVLDIITVSGKTVEQSDPMRSLH